MEDLKLIVKGFIIGIGKIIPGVSGAMFAMMFGVYEKSLNIISNLKKEFRKNIKFIFLIGSSVTLAIILGSSIIKNCLDNYYLPTMMLFIGMMAGGIKPLFKNVSNEKVTLSNIICSVVVVILLGLLSFVNVGGTEEVLVKTPFVFLTLILAGFCDAFATVVPGICGTALLMILGYYNTVINSLSDIFNITNIENNLFVLIPFLIGLLFGIYIISKMINYFFKNFKVKTYYSIIGFAIMSIILLFKEVFEKTYNINEIILSAILFVVGYIIVYILEKNNKGE